MTEKYRDQGDGNNARAIAQRYLIPILYRPDYNRRLRIHTESADLLVGRPKALAGLCQKIFQTYWHLPPVGSYTPPRERTDSNLAKPAGGL